MWVRQDEAGLENNSIVMENWKLRRSKKKDVENAHT